MSDDFTTEAYFEDFWEQQSESTRNNGEMRAIAMRTWDEAVKMSESTLASQLIDVWCRTHGGQIPWDKAIRITAIVCNVPDEERDRLLNM